AYAKVKVTSKRQITLPVAVCKAMGIEKGDELEVVQEPSGLLLRKSAKFEPITPESSILRFLGSAAGPGGPGSERHHHLIADEAAADDRP
ncbi:MAG: AbrB/MazE/SpoVT family DNA-binding domain-containing protein, partial [Cyanobacteria bacterium REEB65]|nr:AbrB/MazE/SpoVT family DNA-binding domain-containing protein [Cyanobacteria bacterium REEB65]